MDDESKQLLREIRDLQREQLTLLRTSHEQVSAVNKLALENQTAWHGRNKASNRWFLIIVSLVVAAAVTMAVVDYLRSAGRL